MDVCGNKNRKGKATVTAGFRSTGRVRRGRQSLTQQLGLCGPLFPGREVSASELSVPSSLLDCGTQTLAEHPRSNLCAGKSCM